jgi:hypothetical protein
VALREATYRYDTPGKAVDEETCENANPAIPTIRDCIGGLHHSLFGIFIVLSRAASAHLSSAGG